MPQFASGYEAARADGWCEIPLTNGGVALVDAGDFARVSMYRWRRDQRKNGVNYAIAYLGGGRTARLHQFVLGTHGTKTIVDHINRDGLDNRRSNLRLVDRAVNAQNSHKRRGTTSRFRGVFFESATGCWRAQIVHLNRRLSLGRFEDETEAAIAYNTAAAQLYGPNARMNEV